MKEAEIYHEVSKAMLTKLEKEFKFKNKLILALLIINLFSLSAPFIKISISPKIKKTSTMSAFLEDVDVNVENEVYITTKKKSRCIYVKGLKQQ